MQSALKQVNADITKLENQWARSEAYSAGIVKEQKAIITAAEAGIAKANRDLRALRHRLEPYVSKIPKAPDPEFADLKHRYEKRLQERAVLERTIQMAEESIAGAELHRVGINGGAKGV